MCDDPATGKLWREMSTNTPFSESVRYRMVSSNDNNADTEVAPSGADGLDMREPRSKF